jgi:hypothetical protein
MNTTRPKLTEILKQDEFWWTREGEQVRLVDMGPRHKRNTLAMLRRNNDAMSLRFAVAVFDNDASDETKRDAAAFGADDWLEEMPLIKRLHELIAADQAAGVPDEPDERIGKPLPCASWCLTCAGQTFEPGAPLPCAFCPDCSPAVAAADDATWD